MAFRFQQFNCNICATLHHVRQTVLVDQQDNQKMDIILRRREELGNNYVNNNGQEIIRICFNCNRSILEEIREYAEDDDPTILKVIFPNNRNCCICNEPGNQRLSIEARIDVYVKREIFIPEHARTCQHHLDNKGFLFIPIVNGLRAITRPFKLKGRDLNAFLSKLSSQKNNERFDDENHYSDEELKALTSLNKDQFRELFNFCGNVNIYGRSRIISKKDLLCFLFKLRQGLSDEFLRAIFSFSTRQCVSLSISKVRTTLIANFVPQNLGLEHINRQEFVRQHVTPFSNILYNPEPNIPRAIAFIDGTYMKIQKSRNFQVLRKSFSVHKSHHLLKPALIVAPDGYILDVHGPYFSNAINNDAAMLRHEYENDVGTLRNWFEEGDIFVLDRGYRDAQVMLNDIGIHIEMPAALGNRNQLTTIEANSNRLITKNRWIIESRNGHIKSVFKFLRDVIPNIHVPYLSDYIKIVCALLNKYHPVITMQEATEVVAQRMLQLRHQQNEVQARVEREGLIRRHGLWIPLEQNEIHNFPIMGMDELRNLTFGVFQIKLSPSYIQDNHNQEGNVFFEYDHRLNIDNLLRIRLKSRHRNAIKYQMFIHYNYQEMVNQENVPIIGYYCQCKSGARTLGTCCHVASVIWFLAFARHEPHIQYPNHNILELVKDAGHHANANDLPVIVE